MMKKQISATIIEDSAEGNKIRSISKDLTLASVTSIIIIAVIAISILYVYSTRKAHKSLELRCNNYLASLANVLAVPIWQLQKETIDKTGELAKKAGDFILEIISK